jgi:hypothetical protein
VVQHNATCISFSGAKPRDAKSFRALTDFQFELCGKLDRQAAGFGAFRI